MKISKDFILKEIAGEFIVIPVGKNLVDFNAVITLNETGAFLWNQMQNDCDISHLIEALVSEFDVDEETAGADIDEFIKKLTSVGILKND